MQINSRTSAATNASQGTSNNRGIVATVVGLQPSTGKMTLQIGSRQVLVDLQAGLQQGDTIELGPKGNSALQQLVASIEAQSPSLADVLQILSPSSTNLGQILAQAATALSNPNTVSSQADTSALALLQTVLPQLTDTSLTSSDQSKLATQLLSQLANSDSSAAQDLGTELQQILPTLFPNIDLNASPIQVSQGLLGALASNDFTGAVPLLKQLTQLLDTNNSPAAPISSAPQNASALTTASSETVSTTSTTAIPPLSDKDLQALTRLLAPLQELDAWGSPEPQMEVPVQTARAQVEQAVSLPLTAQTSATLFNVLANQPQASQTSFIAKIIAVNDHSVSLEVTSSADAAPETRAPIFPASPSVIATTTAIQAASPPVNPAPPSVIAATTAIQAASPKTVLELPMQATWPPQLRVGNTVACIIIPAQTNANNSPNTTASQLRILPQADSAYLPPQELPALARTNNPLTANLVDARDFIAQYTDVPPSAERVVQFASILHTLDLQLPHGKSLTADQKDLAFRWMLSTPTSAQNKVDLQGLVRYQSSQDPEPDLFQKLPVPQREWLTQQLANNESKPVSAKELQNFLQQMPAASASATPSEREALAQLKSQVQWTHLDQDSRHSEDRQQVVYFSHAGELQKARIQFRNESKAKKAKGTGDSSHSFYIETRTANLGKVHVDFRVKENQVELDFSDATGQAKPAVQSERKNLAKDLDDIGLVLKDISYRLLQKEPLQSKQSQTAPHAIPSHTSLLDLRA